MNPKRDQLLRAGEIAPDCLSEVRVAEGGNETDVSEKLGDTRRQTQQVVPERDRREPVHGDEDGEQEERERKIELEA